MTYRRLKGLHTICIKNLRKISDYKLARFVSKWEDGKLLILSNSVVLSEAITCKNIVKISLILYKFLIQTSDLHTRGR